MSSKPIATPENVAPRASHGDERAALSHTTRLRLYFVAPLTVAIAAAWLAWVSWLYNRQHEEAQRLVAQLQASSGKVLNHSIHHTTDLLRAVMGNLSRDATLRAALAAKDRAALLREATPRFAELKSKFGITHFYFADPGLVNILSVQNPQREGERMEHFTMREALRTGAPVRGLELDHLGMLSLRLADPWYQDENRRHPIGVAEIGVDIDSILQGLKSSLDVQIYIFVYKSFLEREAWEEGMHMLGHPPHWDQFPAVALSAQGAQTLPPALAARFAKGAPELPAAGFEVPIGRARYEAAFVPLRDAQGRTIGQLALLVDVTEQFRTAQRAVYIGGIVGLSAGGALFGFFWWLVGRIGRRLESSERALRELAMRDGLTGLYNHKSFYLMLEDEATRWRRYGAVASVLMLDIDHFKRVNDTYGHVAGDKVLQELSRVVSQAARDIDKVCRYGGEEIALILPETGLENAVLAAERIRTALESHPFEIGAGQIIRITVSIGVATLPEHGLSAQELVAAADQALYAAKEGGRNRVCRYEKPAAPVQ